MEQSSSQPPNFGPDNSTAARGRNGNARPSDSKDPSSRRMVADELMAALASGNLEHLAQARQAFLNEGDADPPQSQGDLAAQLERRSQARPFEHAVVADDDLRAEEEALRQAELELERRRAEVQAAKKKAGAEVHRRAAEEKHRREEEETQQRVTELLAIRKKAEAAAQERARELDQLTAEVGALRASEQEAIKRIQEADANIRAQAESLRHAEAEAKRRAEREQWLTSEIEAQRTAEQEQLRLVEEIQARLLVQMEARPG